MFSLLLLPSLSFASDYLDVWITTAFEDNNVFAGPDLYSPAANFVQRGNTTFFENYERRVTDDISRANLVLYNESDGYFDNWSTQSAFVLRYTPFLNPDMTTPGTNLRDDGSYVRIIRKLPGKKHNISLTGYAVDAGRFRLGYSYDLTWGARSIFSFDPGAVPGVRLQWQKQGSYAFLGMKSAVGDYITPDTREPRNQTYYGYLAGAGVLIADKLKFEVGAGSFQQDQIKNVQDTENPLYGEIITALGFSGQISYRTRTDMRFLQSADLRLYQNKPEMMKDGYITHTDVDGFGALFQAEVNSLQHNLLDPLNQESTTIESALAADVQARVGFNTTFLEVDLVYKDLAYILFNVPGLTSGVAMDPDMEQTAQIYGRANVSHHMKDIHITPQIGAGWMLPATYKTSGGTFVQYTAFDKEQVPDGQEPSPILSSVAGVQIDLSPSTVFVGEVLYSVDNNLSDFVQEEGSLEGRRVSAPDEERQALGFNLMIRSRF
ncbi:MAG: hypothetical protein VXZ96_18155 [Myxococcota bacterium]|nr:hypothetical protein [Myxococcota bacterium]